MAFSDNTLAAENSDDFFKPKGKRGVDVSKKGKKMFLKNLRNLLR